MSPRAAGGVRLRHTVWSHPAREWQGENPLPCLIRETYNNIYPYRERDSISGDTAWRDYEAYVLENDFVRAVISPELGCRLVRLFDLVAGRDVFVVPESLRPTPIFLRGIYLPLGLELNFPQGHNVHSASYIPTEPVELPGGAKGVCMYVYNAVSRLNTRVLFYLNPGERVLRQRITFHNPAPVRSGFMYWANPSVYNSRELRMQLRAPFCYFFTGYNTFPEIDGRDMRLSVNHPYVSDLFAIDSDVDWFGFYDASRNLGALHHAPRELMNGKKMFTWGFDDYARSWGRTFNIASENSYVEIQAGMLGTQLEHSALDPDAELTIDEAWQPLSALPGEVLHAGDEVVISGGPGRAFFGASRREPEWRVEIAAPGGAARTSRIAGLEPGRFAALEVPPNFDCGHFTVTVTAGGRDAMRHTVTPCRPASAERIQAAREWLALTPDTPEHILEIAWRSYKARAFHSARELLARLPEHPEARRMLREIEWWEDRAAGPAPAAIALPQQAEPMPEARLAEADRLYREGDREAARQMLPETVAQWQYLRQFLAGGAIDAPLDAPCPDTVLERDALRQCAEAGDPLAAQSLGNYYSRRDPEAAEFQWRLAAADGRCGVARRNLGYLRLRQRDFAGALAAYEAAFPVLGESGHFLIEWLQAMRVNGRHAEALERLAALPESVAGHSRIGRARAELLLDTGRFAEAIAALSERELFIWEGEANYYRVYRQSRTALGEAALAAGDPAAARGHFAMLLTSPAELPWGNADGTNLALGHYFLGLCARAAGDETEAKRCFAAACDQPFPSLALWPSLREEEYFQALAARELGDDALAERIAGRLLEAGKSARPGGDFLHYVNYHMALSWFRGELLRGDRVRAEAALAELAANVGNGWICRRERERLEKTR